MRYNANLMINLESPIILPYFFICLVKVSLLVGNLFFVGGDVGVAVLDIVAVLDMKSSRLFPLSYLFQKNQYKCDIVPSLPTGLCGIEPVEHAPV